MAAQKQEGLDACKPVPQLGGHERMLPYISPTFTRRPTETHAFSTSLRRAQAVEDLTYGRTILCNAHTEVIFLFHPADAVRFCRDKLHKHVAIVLPSQYVKAPLVRTD